jgi:hypothetical protein
MMTQKLQNHSTPIALAVTFFTVGFFLVSNVLGLTEREIVLGLVAGAAGGLSVLVAVLWNDSKFAASVSPLA